jgi:hypothetical protein
MVIKYYYREKIKEDDVGRACSTYGVGEKRVNILLRRLRQESMWRIKVEDNIKIKLNEVGLRLWVGFIWLRVGASGERLKL